MKPARVPTLLATMAAAASAAPAPALGAEAPARASAMRPEAVDLGVGDSPAVAVDPAGTAHVVFDTAGGETYCRLPRGARACDRLTALPLPGRTGGPLMLRRPADGLLAIVQAATTQQSGSGTTWARYSTDGGVSWQGPFAVGSLGDVSSAALSLDGASVFTLDPAAGAGLTFQRAPFAGPDGRSLVLETPVNGVTYGASSDARIAVLAGGRMVTADQTRRGVDWRSFVGGDPYDPAAWRRGTLRGAARPELVSGPRGGYLLTQRGFLHQGSGAFGLRSFDLRRSRWRAARNAVADTTVYGTSSLFEDAAGRLHLVADTAVTGKVGCVIYARTSKRRSSWFGRSTTIFRTRRTPRFPQDTVVAADAKGRGVAVWQDADAARAGGHVRAVAVHQRGGRYRRIGSEFSRPSCPPA